MLSIYIQVCNKLNTIREKNGRSYKTLINLLKDCWRNISDEERNKEKDDPSWILKEGCPTIGDSSWNVVSQEDFGDIEALHIAKPRVKDEKVCNNANEYKYTPKKNKEKKYKSNNIIPQCQEIAERISNVIETFSKKYHNLFEIFDKPDYSESSASTANKNEKNQ